MSHPYLDRPATAYWRSGVAKADRDSFVGLYTPRFGIDPDTRVATAGSCFAQHIATHLRGAGCTVLDGEAPPRGMSKEVAKTYNYGLFAGRFGNVYTARQMWQLVEEARDGANVEAWAKGDRFVDALRPTIEPDGFADETELAIHRRYHLACLAKTLSQTDVFVFTLGLTEAWVNAETGRVYPVCPGVAGGTFDPKMHLFKNFTHAEVLADLARLQTALHHFNPSMEMLLTVSPVPLTATAGDDHVLAATTYSKAVLRAVAGEFVQTADDVDYFPSFEIVTAPASGMWFADNMRSVSDAGVAKVMRIFLTAHGLSEDGSPPPPIPMDGDDDDDGLVCEELLLDAFSK